ncbi:MAG: hypothetical protein Q9223_000929 [Gallowayella weberi]
MSGSWSSWITLSTGFLAIGGSAWTNPLAVSLRPGLTLPQYATHPDPKYVHYGFHLADHPKPIDLAIAYCDDLKITPTALRRTLYASIWLFNYRVQHEGYDALLGKPFESPEERGSNCIFEIAAHEGDMPVSIGAAAEVLSFLWKWMVRGKRQGSAILVVFVDGTKAATGTLRPRVDPGIKVEG